MFKRIVITVILIGVLVLNFQTADAASGNSMIGINILLNTDITDVILTDLALHGTIRDVVYEIDALTMQVRSSELKAIKQLPYVLTANPDAERNGAPVDTVTVTDFLNGRSTWDLDAINVTDLGAGRTIAYDGTGVYVAVLDTGLVDAWRQYFPEERIAVEYAKAFNGGGGEVGNVSDPTNKWEHDQNSHGTHVTSTIIGYNMRGSQINGVSPMVKVIPVKVLNQNGSGWSSVVAQGITYIGDLKAGPLADYPVVINMSLGGPALDAMEKAAIDYAIGQGVIIVASAGNEGDAGMGYPGAYQPVISVAASGWVGEWTSGTWWYATDVAEIKGRKAGEFYITDFSSRELSGQDLDVAAPGSWIVGPYQVNSGQTSYYYLGGTSMASPHVAGIVALMSQKDATLTASEAESILESTAIPLPAGCLEVTDISGVMVEYCWGDDATGSGLVTADGALQ